MSSYPDIAAFDLDYTVWPCYCDTHISPPFKQVKNSNGEVHKLVDSCGYEIGFYQDVPKILSDLKLNGSKIVSASRTWAPEIAKEMLGLFMVEHDGEVIPLISLIDFFGMGERRKVGHLRDAVKGLYGHENLKTLDICLFDDESRNRDVEHHGVTFVYVSDPKIGTTWELYQSYLNAKL
ncbi:hypothetical protein Kpol_495p4 [Vanderwaltozyma polyspora DSM 70294]|uniref:Magnesium-dependent phosphatase-1 n=1 Tax=Vanderwaltozyma polyspora (strain ATCC 22028 / DSM 70294 / BCRC 21397 / CBS 2163 / NBRC 10782 / NRRL Y-8283 / UCD 57-17) TaxID=436907 RepID=A7TNY1_VANPO|nr:uncharacterized protein Kpol_495p4 [Vanderwaltozyma polyspora DSM 70294]EDO16006.1 hypothetical protein Kpol_495p4 [Vanderwaltozyma polyspora DSM 70294]